MHPQEDPVDAWRRKHRKCLFCEYCERTPYVQTLSSPSTIKWCRAKAKCVDYDMWRPWCKLFKLKKFNKEK